MDVVLAEVCGFCFGVRRAVEMVEESRRLGGVVETFGPLVHNPQETARLAAAGIRTVDRVDESVGATVVIRTHGARPEVAAELAKRAVQIVDATCPFVARSQRLARAFSERGVTLVIVGHAEHPEVQGILGYVSGAAYVLALPDEVESLPEGITPGVIAQTTVDEETFTSVAARLRARYPDCKVVNTVCRATRNHQEAARRLASQVDAIYVVGGRESANTRRLADVCRQSGARTWLIETADEIEPDDLVGLTRIGVTAGASTPDWLIRQVVDRLSRM